MCTGWRGMTMIWVFLNIFLHLAWCWIGLEILLCHHNIRVSKLCLDFWQIGDKFILAENKWIYKFSVKRQMIHFFHRKNFSSEYAAKLSAVASGITWPFGTSRNCFLCWNIKSIFEEDSVYKVCSEKAKHQCVFPHLKADLVSVTVCQANLVAWPFILSLAAIQILVLQEITVVFLTKFGSENVCQNIIISTLK